eukprot:tig00000404_g399.t1
MMAALPLFRQFSLGSMEEKTIIDRVYGEIRLSGRLAAAYLHPAVKRLDGLRQLGGASFWNPNLNHVRLAHSVGVAHLAYEWAKALRSNCSREFNRAARRFRMRAEDLVDVFGLAGLLHDVGHAMFSHLFESYYKRAHKPAPQKPGAVEAKGTGFHHEKISAKLVELVLSEPGVGRGLGRRAVDLCKRMICPKRADLTKLGIQLDPEVASLEDGHWLLQIVSGAIDCAGLFRRLGRARNDGYTAIYDQSAVKAAEAMLAEAMAAADPALGLSRRAKAAANATDPAECFAQVRYRWARGLLRRLYREDYYPCAEAGGVQDGPRAEGLELNEDEICTAVAEEANRRLLEAGLPKVPDDRLRVQVLPVGYGNKDRSPLEKVAWRGTPYVAPTDEPRAFQAKTVRIHVVSAGELDGEGEWRCSGEQFAAVEAALGEWRRLWAEKMEKAAEAARSAQAEKTPTKTAKEEEEKEPNGAKAEAPVVDAPFPSSPSSASSSAAVGLSATATEARARLPGFGFIKVNLPILKEGSCSSSEGGDGEGDVGRELSSSQDSAVSEPGPWPAVDLKEAMESAGRAGPAAAAGRRRGGRSASASAGTEGMRKVSRTPGHKRPRGSEPEEEAAAAAEAELAASQQQQRARSKRSR